MIDEIIHKNNEITYNDESEKGKLDDLDIKETDVTNSTYLSALAKIIPVEKQHTLK